MSSSANAVDGPGNFRVGADSAPRFVRGHPREPAAHPAARGRVSTRRRQARGGGCFPPRPHHIAPRQPGSRLALPHPCSAQSSFPTVTARSGAACSSLRLRLAEGVSLRPLRRNVQDEFKFHLHSLIAPGRRASSCLSRRLSFRGPGFALSPAPLFCFLPGFLTDPVRRVFAIQGVPNPLSSLWLFLEPVFMTPFDEGTLQRSLDLNAIKYVNSICLSGSVSEIFSCLRSWKHSPIVCVKCLGHGCTRGPCSFLPARGYPLVPAPRSPAPGLWPCGPMSPVQTVWPGLWSPPSLSVTLHATPVRSSLRQLVRSHVRLGTS